MIYKSNVYDLEKLTGIVPRDNWHTKARGGQVYNETTREFKEKTININDFVFLEV